MKNLILVFIVLFSNLIFSQEKSTKKLESPIDFPILLSGNFGELRSSGFHSGIDIKTKGKEGIDIRAIDAGYVSRVQVSTSGFGKVVYINSILTKPIERNSNGDTISNNIFIIISWFTSHNSNLPITPQTKNPTNVGRETCLFVP